MFLLASREQAARGGVCEGLLCQTQARAHLVNVGIIRPREEVSASDINAFLSRPEGAPPSVGKIADPDKIDVARFLNRCRIRLSCLFALCMRG